jgi:hypothetical protein
MTPVQALSLGILGLDNLLEENGDPANRNDWAAELVEARRWLAAEKSKYGGSREQSSMVAAG